MSKLSHWTTLELARALLDYVWLYFDGAGQSHGRSAPADALERARDLLALPRPEGDIATWPPLDAQLAEARRRVRDRPPAPRLDGLPRAEQLHQVAAGGVVSAPYRDGVAVVVVAVHRASGDIAWAASADPDTTTAALAAVLRARAQARDPGSVH